MTLVGTLVLAFASGCGHSAAQASSSGGLAEVAPEAVAGVPSAGEAVAAEAESAVAGAPRARMQVAYNAPIEGGAAGGDALPGTKASDRVVINGTVAVRTVDVAELVLEVRTHAAEVGGTVVGETLRGNAEEGHASMRLRLPPSQAVPFADWLAARATLESRNLSSEDVSRQYVDQQLAIKNLQITMGRLQELARRPDAPLKDVLEAERELTRVRGELERLEGEHRLLEDQVARATLVVEILARRGAHPPPIHVEPELKFELVPRFVLTHFLDARGRDATRYGGGVTLMFARSFSLDFTALPRDDEQSRSFLADAVVAGYSDFLGAGRRRFLNPYLGVRVGGGVLEGYGTFDFGADVGLELLHYRQFIVEVTGRAQWFIYHADKPYDLTLTGTAGIGVPF
jgi:hypothetical protein